MEGNQKSIKKVFISYAHDNDTHRKFALDLADELTSHSIYCYIDQYFEDGETEIGWTDWMYHNILDADFVLVVASQFYAARFNRVDIGEGPGKGAKFEAILTRDHIYNAEGRNKKYIPIYFQDSDRPYIPELLRNYDHYNISRISDRERLFKRIKGELRSKRPILGAPLERAPSYRKEKIVNANAEVRDAFIETAMPIIPQFTHNMKPGTKIIQAYFDLPLTTRFRIAHEIGVAKEDELYSSKNAEELCQQFLIRAKDQNKLSQLWDTLFNNPKTDPNPFK